MDMHFNAGKNGAKRQKRSYYTIHHEQTNRQTQPHRRRDEIKFDADGRIMQKKFHGDPTKFCNFFYCSASQRTYAWVLQARERTILPKLIADFKRIIKMCGVSYIW